MRGTYKYHSLDIVDDNTASLGRRPSRKFGTNVGWEDCPVDKFVNHFLPLFDKQNGIRSDGKKMYRTIQEPAKPIESKPEARKPQRARALTPEERAKQIAELLAGGPLTVREVAQRLGLKDISRISVIMAKRTDLFRVVGRVVRYKNPRTMLWGLVNEGKKA